MIDTLPRARRPLVLVPACNRVIGETPYHVAGKKYVDAVRLAGAQPLVVPSAEMDELDDLLERADGIVLTGSPSNVDPSHFGQAVHDPSLPLDPVRDAWTLPLIGKALAAGVPLLGICRGMQEVNIALGGTLHQTVHEVPGYADHRWREDDPTEVQYADKHAVQVVPGGVLESIVQRPQFRVNTLHGQGVDRLGTGIRAEARAPDGLVEAFSVEHAPAFNLCVQWHPEWRAADNEISRLLLAAFGQACRARQQSR